MRKITQNAASAFIASQPFAAGNTTVSVEAENDAVTTKLLLHGNIIAKKRSDRETVQMTLAGWPTVTTRERLNGLLRSYGMSDAFCQRNYGQLFGFVGGQERSIDANEWINVAV